MGRGGCFLAIICIAMLWGGGQGVYTGLTNTTQTEVTLAEYIKQKPSATWLKLKDCDVNAMDAAYLSKFGSISEIYIPLRVPGSNENDKVHVLLAMKDGDTFDLLKKMKDITDQKEMLSFVLQNKQQLIQTRAVEGTIRFGINLKDKDREKLANLDKNLAPDFAILSEGEKPDFILSGLMLIGGIVMAFVLLGALSKTSKT